MRAILLRVAKILGAAAAVLLGLAAAGVWWLATNVCSNTEQRRVASPDGRRELVVFERDCGATTDFSTEVSVLRRGARLPNRGGNAYVTGGLVRLEVAWASETTATVRYAAAFKGYHDETRVAGVTVRAAGDSTIRGP